MLPHGAYDVVIAGASFAGLAVWRKAARGAPPPRLLGARGTPALGNLFGLVDAHDQMADDIVNHLQPPVDFLHQIARSVDHFQDVCAFLLVGDFIGKLPATPVLGLLEPAAHTLHDGFHLGMEIGDLIVEVRSATAGVGSYTCKFDHMAELAGRNADQIVAARKASAAAA